MLLEEKLYVLEQIKRGNLAYDSSPHYLFLQEKDQREDFPMTPNKFLFFSLRVIISLLLFTLCYLMIQREFSLFQLTTNDLQYYLTRHYFLP